MSRKGYLVMENGRVYTGEITGYNLPVSGEAVFNTSMNGYQEIITDPSYAGQILVLTYPQIGNYGFGDYGFEAEKPALQGLVVREASALNGHYESKWGFNEFMERFGVSCLTGVDTRAITRNLRTEGNMGSVISDNLDDMDHLLRMAREGKKMLEDINLVPGVSTKSIKVLGEGSRQLVLWDFGCKQNIIDSLLHRDCRLVCVPARTTAEDIMSLNPDGIVLSNGPGDPAVCSYAVDEMKKILNKLPIFGICLGHQLLSTALGGTTFKLRFGHRGGNHSVRDNITGKCYITSQNHGYAVDRDSLDGTGAVVRFINLTDDTVEGIFHPELPLMSVQFHPEASPGPQDTSFLFEQFIQLVDTNLGN
ncbi:MAG: glutamine-hydrolyzing carbamoyl-phosphate synthase small subunit [Deltaproteobacteria bacterium]